MLSDLEVSWEERKYTSVTHKASPQVRGCYVFVANTNRYDPGHNVVCCISSSTAWGDGLHFSCRFLQMEADHWLETEWDSFKLGLKLGE